MRKIAAYIRVSTQDQADFGYGLDVQKEKIIQYCSLFDIDNKELVWFIDEGRSAKSLNRPEMKMLLNSVKENQIEKVIIFKLDRLSRSVIDTYDLINTFMENNCSLVAVIDQIDISSANGRMFVGMLAIIAQWERETISERTVAGMREMAFQGKYPFGRPPYGYSKNQDHILYINDHEANVIKSIISHLKQSGSLKKTVNYLNEEMIDGRVWKYQTVSKMFNNSFYRGHLETKTYAIKDHHEALISEKDYAIFKQSVNRNKDTSNVVKHTYLFHGKIFCDLCGQRCRQEGTTKKNGDRYTYYRCPDCKRSINENNIIDEIKFVMICDFNNKQDASIVDGFRNKLNTIAQKQEEVMRGYLTDKWDLEFYKKTSERLSREKRKIHKTIDELIITKHSAYKVMSHKEKLLFFAEIYDSIYMDTITKKIVSVNLST